MAKKKHKKKGAKGPQGTVAFIGAVLSQAIGQILGDAVEVAAERLTQAQQKASKAIKKKARQAKDGAQAVAP